MDQQTKVTGVILAGGLARRMNYQDKGLVPFKGRPMVSYSIALIEAVADETVVSANRNLPEYRKFGLPVISDETGNFDGPLAGILAAMRYAETGLLLVLPCDSPLIEARHLQKLLDARAGNNADAAAAFDGERLHPVFLALKASLKSGLEDYLRSGQRKVETWLEQQKTVKADFSDEPGIFININSMTDLSALEANCKK